MWKNNTLLEFFYDKEKTKKKKELYLGIYVLKCKTFIRLKKEFKKKLKKKITIGRGKTDGVLKFWLRDFENNLLNSIAMTK